LAVADKDDLIAVPRYPDRCVSAETGHDIADRRPPSRLEQQVARARCAAADDDLVGIERVDRVRDADAKSLAP
jgi:hypothetical protein